MTVDVRGKRFSILGAARSGLAAAELLHRHGASVFVSDRGAEAKFADTAAALRRIGVPFEFGMNSARVLECDVLVLSPGVPSDAEPVRNAVAHGVTVVSEFELASWFCQAPIVAITGTNGKTTTTTLIGKIFADARMRSIVAGNIGTAFSQVAEQVPSEGTAILEVSSFQLDFVDHFRPSVAVILNITPDHLDRYEHAFEKYAAAKMRIAERQTTGDTLIYNEDDPVTRDAVNTSIRPGVHLLPFSTRQTLSSGAWVRNGMLTINAGGADVELLPVAELGIRGEHNLANAMAASLAATLRGVPADAIAKTLREFRGVEHRLEFIRDLDGVRYINDSKATNVDSVWYALQSYDRPLVVLIGGRDKGNDYSRLNDLVRKHVKSIVAIGESADKVVSAFSSIVTTRKADDMPAAVAEARRLAASGDIVLLSPACASFDWFTNYEHRGQVFKQLVLDLH
jgi:UDP-N-acetylmuramoylalanine--D-glutamate ligase